MVGRGKGWGDVSAGGGRWDSGVAVGGKGVLAWDMGVGEGVGRGA